MDRVIRDARIREFLDGLTAAVVGLTAGTVVALLVTTARDVYNAVVFTVALALLFYSKHKLIVPLVVAGAAGVGAVAMAVG